MTKVLMCLFIVCETKFTIGESRTISHANFPPKLLWNENADFKFSVNNEGEDVNKKPQSRRNIDEHSEGNADNNRQRNRRLESVALWSFYTVENPDFLVCRFPLRACEASALRARKTLTPRFTDFFYWFWEKNRLFCSLINKHIKMGLWSSVAKSMLPGNAKCSMTSLADTKHIFRERFIYEASNFAAKTTRG